MYTGEIGHSIVGETGNAKLLASIEFTLRAKGLVDLTYGLDTGNSKPIIICFSPMDGHPHHLIHGRPFYGQPPPPLQQPPTKSKAERPSSLGSVIGIHPAPNSQSLPPVASQQVKSGGKRTRWLLCYPAGGAARCQFHQHFMSGCVMQKCITQFFSNYSLAL